MIFIYILNSRLRSAIKLQTGAVDAIPCAKRTRSIIENVSQVAFTISASDFDPFHANRVVLLQNYFFSGGVGEGRPAARARELFLGCEKETVAACTPVLATSRHIPKGVRERPFGSTFA